MIQLPLGCFWAIEKPFDAQLYFKENRFRLKTSAELLSKHYSFYAKLWQRKYLFYGDCHAISIESEKYFYFYEDIPGQLFHCDAPSINIAKATNRKILCFYSYEGNQSCGLKIYSNDIIRHIESATSYKLHTNFGSYLEDADTLINVSKTFNHQQLQLYIQQAINETPPSPYHISKAPHQFYTFNR